MGRGNHRFKNSVQKPKIRYPAGIGPPIKEVIGQEIVKGKEVTKYSYYQVVKFTDETNGNPSSSSASASSAALFMGEDVIDFDTYVKEQQGVIRLQNILKARLKEKLPAFKKRIEEHNVFKSGDVSVEWMKLYDEFKQISARRNIPSKDWKPLTNIIPAPGCERMFDPAC